MGEVICWASGKGGTGKTTVCASVASCLAAQQARVLCIDTDIGLRNLDIALGMADQPAVAFTELLRGAYTLADAAVHPQLPLLRCLTAPVRDDPVEPGAFGVLLDAARREFDFVLLDAPAGIGEGFRLATHYADRCVVVCNCDPASLRDAAHTAGLLRLTGKEGLSLLVNRVTPRRLRRLRLTIDDMMDQTALPLLGLVPEDENAVFAAAAGQALLFATDTGAAEASLRIARRLRGVATPLMNF